MAERELSLEELADKADGYADRVGDPDSLKACLRMVAANLRQRSGSPSPSAAAGCDGAIELGPDGMARCSKCPAGAADMAEGERPGPVESPPCDHRPFRWGKCSACRPEGG